MRLNTKQHAGGGQQTDRTVSHLQVAFRKSVRTTDLHKLKKIKIKKEPMLKQQIIFIVVNS